MFGSVRRKSSNVRAMQLFHELKQQFPTLPDHVVSACIANHAHKADKKDLRETLEVAAAQQEPMGRTLTETSEIAALTSSTLQDIDCGGCTKIKTPNTVIPSSEVIPKPERRRRRKKLNNAMDAKENSECVRYDKNTDSVEANPLEDGTVKVGKSSFFVRRPNTLNLKVNDTVDRSFNNIQPSGRCSDVHKLLNTELVNSKPPRSPLSAKKFNHKNSPTKGSPRSPSADSAETKKTEPKTVETPTQTTDTLLGDRATGEGLVQPAGSPAGVNLSVNVNCSVDVVQSPTRSKCTTSLQLVPQQPWCQDIVSPKSYTSVNLTLRPPSSQPQAPIDITSQNSCLTYSTSSFDPQKGLQSKLQITVGPSGGGVASMRTRPRSSYHPDNQIQDLISSNRTGSLPDLTDTHKTTIKDQQVRIDKLKIELRTEKVRLVAMQQEVAELENLGNEAEKEVVLQKEIIQLQEECKKLTIEVDNRCGSTALPLGETRAIFYDNIYTGQRPPLGLGFPTEQITTQQSQNSDIEGPKWNCHMCTFQNHPLLSKCEQCDMPRILHGKKQDQQMAPRGEHPFNYAGRNNNNNNGNYPSNYHPDRPYHTQYSAGPPMAYGQYRPNMYANQYSCPANLSLSPGMPRANGFFGGGNVPSPTRYQLYSPTNQRSNLNPTIPSQVYNPFGTYNMNYLPNGTINSSTSSHGSN